MAWFNIINYQEVCISGISSGALKISSNLEHPFFLNHSGIDRHGGNRTPFEDAVRLQSLRLFGQFAT